MKHALKALVVCIATSLALSSPALAAYGKIIIKKKAIPQDAQDFGFDISRHSPSGFFLDDDDDGTLSNQKTFIVHVRNYRITEQVTLGWQLKSIECTSQNGPNNNTVDLNGRNVVIRIQPDEIVTCTFTNEKMAPTSAPVVISGKVLTANGSGVSGASVRVSDLASGKVFTGFTSTFGYYTVDGPTAGSFIDVSVSAKGRQFNSVQLNVLEDVVDLDFVESRIKSETKSRHSLSQREKTLEELNEEIIDTRIGTKDNQ